MFASLQCDAATLIRVVLQYRERIIFVGQAIDDELGNQLVGTMLYLDSENHKDMRLYINTTGGDVRPFSFALAPVPSSGSAMIGGRQGSLQNFQKKDSPRKLGQGIGARDGLRRPKERGSLLLARWGTVGPNSSIVC